MEPEIYSEQHILRTQLKSPQSIDKNNLHVDSKKTRPLSDQNISNNKNNRTLNELFHEANLIYEKNNIIQNNSNLSTSSDSTKSDKKQSKVNLEQLLPKDIIDHQETNGLLDYKSNSLKAGISYNIYNDKDTIEGLPIKRSNKQQNNKIMKGEDFENDLFLQDPMDLLYVPNNCAESIEQFGKYVWKNGWKAMPHHVLPNWLRDNDYLLKGHRPPLPSSKECFKSIFRIHTETGNIWTHLIGALSFIGIAIYFLTRPNVEIQYQEKIVFGAFFLGAIICLFCSALFHTFYCYSPSVSKFFNKIDYCGISILTIGSFVPWLYYAFYCESVPKLVYLLLIVMLGVSCIIVSLWDKFSEPEFRAIRAGMFIALGLSGLIPAVHYSIIFGGYKAFNVGALGWLVLMAILYIAGACLYAARIPERLFPGKFDIWFQSHQIFHVFVVIAAYVHYHGITKLASYRLTLGDCLTAHLDADFSFEF